jgi:hypothetical protein
VCLNMCLQVAGHGAHSSPVTAWMHSYQLLSRPAPWSPCLTEHSGCRRDLAELAPRLLIPVRPAGCRTWLCTDPPEESQDAPKCQPRTLEASMRYPVPQPIPHQFRIELFNWLIGTDRNVCRPKVRTAKELIGQASYNPKWNSHCSARCR